MIRAILVVLLIAATADAKVRAVRHPADPRSVMWIAAHPDDEAVVAPLLMKWCREQGARCAMLILTRGEAGPCLRTELCGGDLRSVRSAEAAAAAELFGADLVLLRLPDGQVQSAPEIVDTVAAYIEAFRPELVLTFDPRHGTTCHPDHRATGRIVEEAVVHLPFPTKLYFVETLVRIATDPVMITFEPAIPNADRFDAQSRWSAIVADMQRHPSQFDQAWIDAIEKVPFAERVIHVAPAANAFAQPVAPCPE